MIICTVESNLYKTILKINIYKILFEMIEKDQSIKEEIIPKIKIRILQKIKIVMKKRKKLKLIENDHVFFV